MKTEVHLPLISMMVACLGTGYDLSGTICTAAPIVNTVAVTQITVAALGEDAPDDEEPESPVDVARGENGRIELTVGAEVRERIGLRAAQVESASRRPEVIAYGMLENDPAQTATLRAPVNGFLRASPTSEWPQIGTRVNRGDVVAVVQPRFTAAESFDLLTRWTEAQAEIEQLTAEVVAARASLENKKKLNAAGGLVSDRAVDDATALFAGEEARLEAARKKAAMIDAMLTGGGDAPDIFQLESPADGIVVDVMASLGESVDSGQPLLRLMNPASLIASVSLPIGVAMPTPDAPARIIAVGHEDVVLNGVSMGLAAMRNPTTRGPTLIYQVETENADVLRAGTPVRAYLTIGGDEVQGILVPRSAIIRLGGLTWVYVQTGDDTFERRSITLRAPEADGWFVPSGDVVAGDTVVVAGAQLLLSEEQKAQIESEAEASE